MENGDVGACGNFAIPQLHDDVDENDIAAVAADVVVDILIVVASLDDIEYY